MPGIYDLEVDTAGLSPEACAELIYQRLTTGPPGTAFQQLAALAVEAGNANDEPQRR